MPDDGPDYGKLATAGFEIAVGVSLGAWAGSWCDGKFHSRPWCLIAGILIGCAGGMYLLIKEATKANKD